MRFSRAYHQITCRSAVAKNQNTTITNNYIITDWWVINDPTENWETATLMNKTSRDWLVSWNSRIQWTKQRISDYKCSTNLIPVYYSCRCLHNKLLMYELDPFVTETHRQLDRHSIKHRLHLYAPSTNGQLRQIRHQYSIHSPCPADMNGGKSATIRRPNKEANEVQWIAVCWDA